MEYKQKEYTDEHGLIRYGLQFGTPSSRPVWRILEVGDDPATDAILRSMTTYGGSAAKRAELADTEAHLLRSIRSMQSDAWVGWRHIKALLLNTPAAEGEDILWMMLVEQSVREKAGIT